MYKTKFLRKGVVAASYYVTYTLQQVVLLAGMKRNILLCLPRWLYNWLKQVENQQCVILEQEHLGNRGKANWFENTIHLNLQEYTVCEVDDTLIHSWKDCTDFQSSHDRSDYNPRRVQCAGVESWGADSSLS